MASNPSKVELQVMWNRLVAVVDEQAQALMHTAFSPIVRESGDISAGVFDVQGIQGVAGGSACRQDPFPSGRQLSAEFQANATIGTGNQYGSFHAQTINGLWARFSTAQKKTRQANLPGL